MLHIHLTSKRIRTPVCRAKGSIYVISRRHASYKAKAFVPNENGPNAHIIRWLTKEMENEGQSDEEKGPYKARAFQRACKAIDVLPEPIKSGEEAINIVGIGEGIARRIDEYLNQDSERISSKPPPPPQKTGEEIERENCMKEFQRVPGIGPVKAKKLYDSGCRSLADLKKPNYAKSLSSSSRAALDYVDHLGERVTLAEAQSVLQRIHVMVSHEIKAYLVGSFRRGLPTFGDIDIIFFHPSCVHVPRPGEKSPKVSSTSATQAAKRRGRPSKRVKEESLLRELILAPLERVDDIAATLTEGPRKWQGIVRIRKDDGVSESGLPKWSCIYRRMDLSLYPFLSEGAALLATTGDADFNAHIRRKASEMGLHLNEYGLWKFCRRSPPTLSDYENTDSPSTTEEDGHWELVASRTEKEILHALGVEYVEPERRNFAFVVSRSKQGMDSLLKSLDSRRVKRK